VVVAVPGVPELEVTEMVHAFADAVVDETKEPFVIVRSPAATVEQFTSVSAVNVKLRLADDEVNDAVVNVRRGASAWNLMTGSADIAVDAPPPPAFVELFLPS
jgi:hypothetical protein